ncbi:hypothetical protein U1E44_15130 [Arenibacter sp. GZD96]|uniref:hypothetical protein n=1 Tax=Aurantibrevibacter litoralis TaxID=3106030 RepID=UPI002AFEBA47|nr:hypothetical protein [Arenibacter sp. GZD-96]MEA1787433.1 hypothetical protein [Arenibacter sp. GZD-96]
MIGLIVLTGCISPKSKYQKEYSLLWKELIKSEAWQNSLMARNTVSDKQQADLYSSTSDMVVVREGLDASGVRKALFLATYDDLVARAYFKIISQSEKADAQLQKEHAYWNHPDLAKRRKNDKDYRRQLALINRKYNAHKAMLEGLKSWNIFSENRSGDLDFFKAENEEAALELFKNGVSEDQIVNTLVYKLADLYHFEEH